MHLPSVHLPTLCAHRACLAQVGTCETIGFSQIYAMMEGEERAAGDFGFDPLNLLTAETESQYKAGPHTGCTPRPCTFP